jgi:hypothetical protein
MTPPKRPLIVFLYDIFPSSISNMSTLSSIIDDSADFSIEKIVPISSNDTSKQIHLQPTNPRLDLSSPSTDHCHHYLSPNPSRQKGPKGRKNGTAPRSLIVFVYPLSNIPSLINFRYVYFE